MLLRSFCGRCLFRNLSIRIYTYNFKSFYTEIRKTFGQVITRSLILTVVSNLYRSIIVKELADIFRVLRYHGLEFYSDLSIPANVTDSNCISRLRCIFTRCCFTVFHSIFLSPSFRLIYDLARTFILDNDQTGQFSFFNHRVFCDRTETAARNYYIIYVFLNVRSFNVYFATIINKISNRSIGCLNFGWPIDG